MSNRTFAAFARLAAVAMLATFLYAGSGVAALRFGTDGTDTLVGTSGDDEITGLTGNDRLAGKAGNDMYYFADNFGTDTLIEKAGQGGDTLNFHGVTGGRIEVFLIPEWVTFAAAYNSATGPGGDVQLAHKANGQTVQSIIENAIGGQGNFDYIEGGGGKNILQPGGGGTDTLLDVGGYDDGAGDYPEIPVSNDVYKGFASNTGYDLISDWGGSGDVLDLRPFSRADVYLASVDLDNTPATLESLQIVTSPTTQIVVVGQFGEYSDYTSDTGQHGRIETIIFADKTITDTSPAKSLVTTSAEATSGKQAQLAKAADELAKEARILVEKNDPLGLHRTTDSATDGKATRAEPDTRQKEDKHAKHQHHDRS